MGRWHARAIRAAGGTVVAVADFDPHRARAVASSARPFTSVEELLESVRVDVLHVCTPVAAHADLVTAALAAGAHVIVEKPAAPDGPTTRLLVERAQAADRRLIAVHQFVHQPGVQRLLARRAELGNLVRCSFVAASAGSQSAGMDPDELVSEILPHPLSLFARFITQPLGDLTWETVRPARGELRATAVARGTSLEIAISANGRPTRTELEVMGARATGRADLYHGFSVIDRGRPTRLRKLARPFTTSSHTLVGASLNLGARVGRRETAYPGLRQLVRSAYDSIARGPTGRFDGAELIAVSEARDRILAGGRDPARSV